jgi:hypothetical protein
MKTISQPEIISMGYRLVGEINRLMERFIHVIFPDSSAGVCPVLCLQYLQKIRTPDSWFLLGKSAKRSAQDSWFL